ncbi:hypothetical protein WJX72_012326 [[Myrmecia] bisecta]|uniref:Zinc-binding loop region of homing endonuclease domain-containing protein n=1 Tax=[Myrmecia] bisecta TaxID=41462 RepID=A0AAW1PL75_9CHLO
MTREGAKAQSASIWNDLGLELQCKEVCHTPGKCRNKGCLNPLHIKQDDYGSSWAKSKTSKYARRPLNVSRG